MRGKTNHPRPEKPKARASEPKPPRVTVLELASDEVAPADPVDDELPKKLYRDERPPPPPPPEELRVEHAALVCGSAGAAIVGEAGSQLSRGISA